MYFRYQLITTPGKEPGPSFEQIWIPYTQGWNWRIGSWEEGEGSSVYCRFFRNSLPLKKKEQGPSFEHTWILFLVEPLAQLR